MSNCGTDCKCDSSESAKKLRSNVIAKEKERRAEVRQKYLPKAKKRRKMRVKHGRSSNMKFVDRLKKQIERKNAILKFISDKLKARAEAAKTPAKEHTGDIVKNPKVHTVGSAECDNATVKK